MRIKNSNEDGFGQLLDKHNPTRELINENRVKKSYYELFFNKKNDVVGPLKLKQHVFDFLYRPKI